MAVVLPTTGLFSQTPSFITDSLDKYVEEALIDWQVPGVAVLVVKDGKVIVEKGYGYLETGKPGKVDENTLFMIASNTKAFTGTALAMLEQEGKCSMADPVQKYLPGFQNERSMGHTTYYPGGCHVAPDRNGNLPGRFHVLGIGPDHR